MSGIRINARVEIPEDELEFVFSRSSGPGGQHVNRVETRVTLRFDVATSPSLTDYERRRIRTGLATRIGKDGFLRVSSQRFRSREGNRRAAVERFVELVSEALRPPKPRRPTRMPKSVKRRRLQDKRHRGDVKKSRGRPSGDD